MRLIDADVPREQMSKLLGHHLMMLNYSADGATQDCINFLDDAPTVDAVEVVRCGECKYWGEEEFAEGGYRACECPNKDYATTDPKNHAYFPLTIETDFCSYGERKEAKG